MKIFGILVIFIFYDTIHVQAQTKWVDYRNIPAVTRSRFSNVNNSTVICKASGLTCGLDCRSVYLCAKTQNGFVSVLAENCGGYGWSCSNGRCSTVPSRECSNGAKYEFVCKGGDGVFPDPANCRKYHYCTPEKEHNEIGNRSTNNNLYHTEAYCESGYAYNETSTYCDIPLEDGEDCPPSNIEVCQEPGQTGVTANPSIYYICLPYFEGLNTLYPHIYRCSNGKRYNGFYECF